MSATQPAIFHPSFTENVPALFGIGASAPCYGRTGDVGSYSAAVTLLARICRHCLAPWLVSQPQDSERRGGRESAPPQAPL